MLVVISRFSKSQKSDVREIWRRCSASVPNYIINLTRRSRLKIKVKVQGRNRRTENREVKVKSEYLRHDQQRFYNRRKWQLIGMS